MSKDKYIKKIGRIHQLEQLGLNCPKYYWFAYGDELTPLLDYAKVWSMRSFPFDGELGSKEVLKELEIKGLSKFLEPGIVPPHAPVIPAVEAFEMAEILLFNGYYPMACPVIDPKDAVWAGCAWKKKDGILIEIARGPVMVRKVTRDGVIDKSYFMPATLDPDKPVISIHDDGILDAYTEIMLKVPTGNILELSWYRIPIGQQNKNLIFWDIHPDSTYGVQRDV